MIGPMFWWRIRDWYLGHTTQKWRRAKTIEEATRLHYEAQPLCQCAYTLLPGGMVRLKGDPKDMIHADCGKRLQYYRSNVGIRAKEWKLEMEDPITEAGWRGHGQVPEKE